MRGASYSGAPAHQLFGGSSLRARGVLHDQNDNTGATGLIPACAGRPSARPCPLKPSPAHPCVRGASQVMSAGFEKTMGSSLRARGILYLTGPNTSASACSRSM